MEIVKRVSVHRSTVGVAVLSALMVCSCGDSNVPELEIAGAEAAAVDPAVKCESDKNKETGKRAKCRGNVFSKAVKKFETPDAAKLTKCDDKFNDKFVKIEDKAEGACPSEGDATAVASEVDMCLDAVITGLGGPMGAGDDTDKCQSGKVKEAGKYLDCRFKATFKGLKKGLSPDFTKCDEKIVKKFDKLDEKHFAGKGPCATTGDVASVQADLTACADSISGGLAGGGMMDAGMDSGMDAGMDSGMDAGMDAGGGTPVAYRFEAIDFQFPAFILPFSGCAVNQTGLVEGIAQNAINDDGDSPADGLRDLSILLVQNNETQVGDIAGTLTGGDCLDEDPPGSSANTCSNTVGAPMPALLFHHNLAGNCTVGSTVIPAGSAGCFFTDPADFVFSLGSIMIPLLQAQGAAQYDANPATELTTGHLRGFLTLATAMSTILPADLPLVGGQQLSNLLRHAGNCPVQDETEIGPGSEVGWWFEIGFPADRVDNYTP